MNVLKRLQLALVSLLCVATVTACGGGGGSSVSDPVATQTIQWQADGNGAVQFLTNDSQYLGHSLWAIYGQSNETQMTAVTATAAKVSGSATTGYGTIFCYQDTDNFYRLFITTGGYYSVYAKVAGTYTAIIPWTTPQAATLHTGFGVSNVISVTQQSLHNFTISFNGTVETQFSDANFSGGRAGFDVSISPTNENFPATAEDVRFTLTSPIQYPTGASAAAVRGGTLYAPIETNGDASIVGAE